MASVVLGTIGFIAGTATGIPYAGQIGYALGAYLGGTISRKSASPNRVSQQQMELRIPGTEYGQVIPYTWGRFRSAGEWAWNTERRAHRSTTTTGGGGGKGGAPSEPETITETINYDMDVLYLFNINGAKGLRRIWDQGKLIFTADPNATNESLLASAGAETWDRITFYDGNPDQMPDPTYEAAIIAEGKTPIAYRNRCTIMIAGLKMGTSGQVRALSFEICTSATTATGSYMYTIVLGEGPDTGFPDSPTRGYNNAFGGNQRYIGNPLSGQIWLKHINDEEDNGYFTFALLDANTGDVILEYPNGSRTNDPFDGGSHTSVCGVDPVTGACYVGSVYSQYIYQLETSTIDTDRLFNYIVVNTGGGSGAAYGIYVDLDQHLWVPYEGTPGSSIRRLRVLSWIGHVWFEDPVTGGSGFERWLQNAGAIPDRIYFTVGSGLSYGLAYVQISTMTVITVIATPELRGPIQLVGNDGFLYLYRFDTEGLVKATPDGVTVSVCPLAPIFNQLQGVGLQDYQGYVWCTGSVPGSNDLLRVNTVAMTVDSSIAMEPGGMAIIAEPLPGLIALSSVDTKYFGPASQFLSVKGVRSFSTVTPTCVSVESVQRDICFRVGLAAGQIDTAPLAAITRELCSFVWDEVSAGRQPTEVLMAFYFYEMVMSGKKIKFVPRGGASVTTIPYSELGAADPGSFKEPLALRPGNDLERPAQVAITYVNIDDDYKPDTQLSDRLVSATSSTIDARQIAIGSTPSEVKKVADVQLLDLIIGSLGTVVCVRGKYSRLEPTDCFNAVGPDGTVVRLRSVQATDAYPLMEHQAVLDDASILVSEGITSAVYTPQTEVAGIVKTIMRLMDIPILRDSDDAPGIYVAARGDKARFPGAMIVDSSDDVTFRSKAQVRESALIGDTTTALTDWTGGHEVDEISTVEVDMGPFGVLNSTTRAVIFADLGTNLILIGDELLQFLTATFISTGKYQLRGLLRGLRGTEQHMTGHKLGERAIVLRAFGVRRITHTLVDIKVLKYYRGITSGRTLNTATSVRFRDTGVSLMPFSPVNMRATRNASNDAVITFERRTRRQTQMIGALGVIAPLGEADERYETEFYSDGTFTTIVRMVPTTTPTVPYSAANQTADGLTPGAPLHIRTRQMSATVGRGFALEGTV